jgi:hypothetical protein
MMSKNVVRVSEAQQKCVPPAGSEEFSPIRIDDLQHRIVEAVQIRGHPAVRLEYFSPPRVRCSPQDPQPLSEIFLETHDRRLWWRTPVSGNCIFVTR